MTGADSPRRRRAPRGATIALAILVFTIQAHGVRGVGAAPKPLWLVVTRPMFVDALGPLAARRRAAGLRVRITTEPPAEVLAENPGAAFVLLVGDDAPRSAGRLWYVPAKRCGAYRWRADQPKQFASDAAWADWDGDGAPDAAVGRIPARTAAQVRTVVAKILAHERRAVTAADLRLPVWAGAAEYGELIDSMATSLLLQMLRGGAPAWAQPWVMSSDAPSPWCGVPAEQPAAFSGQLRRGGVAACLIGHGTAGRFHGMTHGGHGIGYTAAVARAALAAEPPAGEGEERQGPEHAEARGSEGVEAHGQRPVTGPAPPLVILACSCGAFDGRGESLAEGLLWIERGPVAVVAATRESHPLPNAITGACLLRALDGEARRVGPLWADAMRRARAHRAPALEKALLEVEGNLGVPLNPRKLMADQVRLYAVLGDPATRLRRPERLHGRLEREGGVWRWRVDKPAGAARLHVQFRPARAAAQSPPRDLTATPRGPGGHTGNEDRGSSSRPRLPTAEAVPEPVGGDGTGASAAAMRRAHAAANATWAFRTVATLDAHQAWEGTVAEAGVLRLLAEMPAGLHVVALRLADPAQTAPAGTAP